LNSTELLAQIRRAANLRDTHPEWTTAAILAEATHELRQRFGDVVLRSQGGYWRHIQHQAIVAGRRTYRIPPRAYANAIDKIEIRHGEEFYPLDPLHERDSGSVTSRTGTPTHFLVQNDRIHLYPKPTAAGVIRITYVLRPSTLVAVDAGGVITSVVNELLNNPVNGFGVEWASAPANVVDSGYVDVIHPDGAFDAAIVSGLVSSLSGSDGFFWNPPNTETEPDVGYSDQELAVVGVGDLVRLAGVSEYPMLPEDFHMALVEATAASISLKRGNTKKAATLYAKVEDELIRFGNRIEPRVKFSPALLRRRVGPLRTGRRFFGGFPNA
jgi:hypothetical protein